MRDKYLCQHCFAPAQEVHHIIHLSPQNINDTTVTINPDNLISLCKECHFKEHYADKGEGHKKEQKEAAGFTKNEYVFDENGYIVPPGCI